MALMVRVIDALPVALAASVAVAVMVWVPGVRVVVTKLAPVPIWPSRLEVQTSEAATLPLSLSFAVALKAMPDDWSTVMPLAGAVMLTTGLALMVIVREAVACR